MKVKIIEKDSIDLTPKRTTPLVELLENATKLGKNEMMEVEFEDKFEASRVITNMRNYIRKRNWKLKVAQRTEKVYIAAE